MNTGIAIAAIVVGLVELFFGRTLFWLFVAIGGFLLGWFLLHDVAPHLAGWERVAAGIGAGIVLALLALVLTRVMVSIGGFFVFSAAAVILGRDLGAKLTAGSTSYWVVYVVAGVIGAVLLFIFLDWALIVFTSVAGAGAVARGIFFLAGGPRWVEYVVFVVLLVLGILFQSRRLRGRAAHRGRPPRRRGLRAALHM